MGRKIGFLTAVVAVLLACAGSAQAAASVVLCVPSTAGKAVVSGGNAGSCESDTKKVALPASADEQQTLLSILPHIRFVAGAEPKIRFSGVDVQVVNGTGDTESANGVGNLIIGYNDHPDDMPQTGSHNLVLGTNQSFTSYGGLIGGSSNKLTGPFSAVLGGNNNTASGEWSVVSGGVFNTASGGHSAILGGVRNTAGGTRNTASDFDQAVLGGAKNTASGFAATVFGCGDVTVSENYASNRKLCP